MPHDTAALGLGHGAFAPASVVRLRNHLEIARMSEAAEGPFIANPTLESVNADKRRIDRPARPKVAPAAAATITRNQVATLLQISERQAARLDKAEQIPGRVAI